MSIDNFSREYQPPKIPTHWGTEERRYAQAVADVLDDIYLKYGRLGKKELSAALGKEITDASGNISTLQQLADSIKLEVSNTKVYRYPSEAELIAALTIAGVDMAVGLLWLDTANNLMKRCSVVSPLTWENVQADEVHTSYIDILGSLIKLYSGGKIEMVSGSTIDMLAGSFFKLLSGSGSTAISLDNSRADGAFLMLGGATPEAAPFVAYNDGTIKNVANTYVQTAADNADATHGIVMDVFFPSDVTLVDKVMLSCKFSAFRAYETGAASGGSATATSESGGGAEKTSRSGGGVSSTTNQNVGNTGDMTAVTNTHGPNSNSTGAPSSDSTGPSTELSTASGGNYETSAATGGTDGSSATNTQAAGDGYTGYSGTGNTGAGTAHTHTITNHRHSYTMGASDTGYTQPGATNEGSHTHSGPNHRHTGPSHTHAMGHTHGLGSHTHTAPNHTHGMAHTHNLNQHTHSLGAHTHQMGAHWHNMEHTHNFSISSHTHIVDIDAHTHAVSIPAHTHDMTYGIYEGTTPASCTVYVDGSAVAGLTGVGPFINIDIAGAFLKSGGKIVRDAFHTVEIRPDKLGRISAHMYIKTTQVSKVAGAL